MLSLICEEGSSLHPLCLDQLQLDIPSVWDSNFGLSETPRSLAAVSQASMSVTVIKSEWEGSLRQGSKKRVTEQCGIFSLCTAVTWSVTFPGAQ